MTAKNYRLKKEEVVEMKGKVIYNMGVVNAAGARLNIFQDIMQGITLYAPNVSAITPARPIRRLFQKHSNNFNTLVRMGK